jgi:hypothetical protein
MKGRLYPNKALTRMGTRIRLSVLVRLIGCEPSKIVLIHYMQSYMNVLDCRCLKRQPRGKVL